jgi:hypothetical protein
VGVDKYTIIHPIFGQTIIQTSAFLVSVAFPEANFYETAEQYGKKCSHNLMTVTQTSSRIDKLP